MARTKRDSRRKSMRKRKRRSENTSSFFPSDSIGGKEERHRDDDQICQKQKGEKSPAETSAKERERERDGGMTPSSSSDLLCLFSPPPLSLLSFRCLARFHNFLLLPLFSNFHPRGGGGGGGGAPLSRALKPGGRKEREEDWLCWGNNSTFPLSPA